MNIIPKTEWRQSSDEQRMMIWKIVAEDNFYGMCLSISHKPDEIAPAIYVYMPDDTDRDIQLFSAKGK